MMNWKLLFCGIAIALLCGAAVMAKEPKPESDVLTIPLDGIWAYRMPGTRDIRDLEPDKFGRATHSLPSEERFRLLRESKTEGIRRSLNAAAGGIAEPGFAVAGTEIEALGEAQAVLADNQPRRNLFSSNDEIFLVFFSYEAGTYVHLQRVNRRSDVIQLEFNWVPHMTTDSSRHFALIPLGKLPTGKYRVEIIEAPMDEQPGLIPGVAIDPSWSPRIVCRPFEFSVEGH